MSDLDELLRSQISAGEDPAHLREDLDDTPVPLPRKKPPKPVKAAKGVKAPKTRSKRSSLIGDDADEENDAPAAVAPGAPITTTQAIYDNPLQDKRKLTKQQREKLDVAWNSTASGSVRAASFQTIVSGLQKAIGDDAVYHSKDDFARLVYGIEMPSLSLEWIFSNDVMPLGVLIQIAGQWETGKSALLYEIYRWFFAHNGWALHLDTEGKVDDTILMGMSAAHRFRDSFVMARPENADETQQCLTSTLATAKKSMEGTKEAPGPGRTIPMLLGLDSLSGAPAKETVAKVNELGHTERAYSDIARINSQYMPVLAQSLEGWPIAFAAVNHLNVVIDPKTKQTTYVTKGGKAVSFRECLELNTFRRARISTALFSGLVVELRVAKNSYGPTDRRITTRFLSSVIDNPETGKPETRFMWDWAFATTKLLLGLDGDFKKRLKARDVQVERDKSSPEASPRVRMAALGMADDEYVPYGEFAHRLQANTEVLDRTRDALNIRRRPRICGPGPDNKAYLHSAYAL